MMRRHVITWSLAVVVMVGLSGCVPGYNSMLFYTKTNAGLVVETKPPEVSVDIGRNEGLLSPTFEAGKTPPVMASFRFDSGGGFLANYVGSAFSTGDAAVAMARLYDAPDSPEFAGKKAWTVPNWNTIENKFDSKVDLYLEPKMPWFVPKEDPGAVRPVLFGTDTSFGFKVAWTDPGSPVPDYLRLAYQRRELALAAVTIGPRLVPDPKDNKQFTIEPGLEARVPSLLATVDANVHVGKFLNSGFNYLQYFASGSAATALAMRHDVRAAMLKRLDPESAPTGLGKAFEIAASMSRFVLEDIYRLITRAADPNTNSDAKSLGEAQSVLAGLDELRSLVPYVDPPKAYHSRDEKCYYDATQQLQRSNFQHVLNFWDRLEEGIKNLKLMEANSELKLAADYDGCTSATLATEQERESLAHERQRLGKLLVELTAELKKDKSITRAMEFACTLMIGE